MNYFLRIWSHLLKKSLIEIFIFVQCVFTTLPNIYFFSCFKFRPGFYIRSLLFLSVDNLVRLKITVGSQVSARSHYLVRYFSLCSITSGYTIHPPTEGLIPLTGHPTPCLQSRWITGACNCFHKNTLSIFERLLSKPLFKRVLREDRSLQV